MSEFRLAPEAEAGLDAIWLHIARGSGSVDLATRVVEDITDRWGLILRLIETAVILSRFPRWRL